MQYLQETFSVYMGTEKYRKNYDAINWHADGSDDSERSDRVARMGSRDNRRRGEHIPGSTCEG